MSKVVLVGELNPYGADPRYALYDEPPQSAGGRMRRLVCGLPRREYLRLGRVNLCAGKWSTPAARERARILSDMAEHPAFVLLGRRVARAFGTDLEPFAWRRFESATLVALPHPSGLCRVWNEPGAFERARAVLREACPEVPWGSES